MLSLMSTQLLAIHHLQDTTKNFTPQEASEQLQQLLCLPWSSGSLQTLAATTNIQVSRKGKVLLHTQPNPAAAAVGASAPLSNSSSKGLAPAAAGSAAAGLISLQHDRAKALPINGSIPDPFLQRIGLQTAEGRIKASMQVQAMLLLLLRGWLWYSIVTAHARCWVCTAAIWL
jgi:hypothetical protein